MKRNLPTMPHARVNAEVQWEVPVRALERWVPQLMAADSSDDNTISILDPIGQDPWTGNGVTAKRISAALRSIGAKKDVVVSINSPGGDLFEAIAIYNILREHQGDVTVKVLGIAASAASIIAMAGDEVQIAKSAFLMIHDTWVVALGNKNDLRDLADMLEPFDTAMAEIYAARSGLDLKAIAKMMDAETWITGQAAVDDGFADSLLPSDQVKKSASAIERPASQRLDVALAKAGMPRSERRALLQEFKARHASTLPRETTSDSLSGTSTPRAAEVETVFAAFKTLSDGLDTVQYIFNAKEPQS